MRVRPQILTADEKAYIEEKGIQLTQHHDFTKDRQFQQWVKNLTNNILDGIFPRTASKENEEALQYLIDHQTKKLTCSNEALLLFTPKNAAAFTACLNSIKLPKKDFLGKQEDEGKLYCNYFARHITKLETIYRCIHEIERKETIPYKIAFDSGFIIEDSKDDTYSASHVSEDNLGKTVPMIIRGPQDIKMFKHLVFTTLGHYTSEVHTKGGSRYHYVAIHTIMFQVTRLRNTGARVLVPGYDFLVKNKYIRDYGNEHNLCMFYIVANTKK